LEKLLTRRTGSLLLREQGYLPQNVSILDLLNLMIALPIQETIMEGIQKK